MSTGTWNNEGQSRPDVAGWDVLAERAAAAGVAVLILIGFVSSYTSVRDLAVRVGDFPTWLAPVVPLSFDVGIIVLSLRVLLAARHGRSARVLRALVLALSVATVVVNGVASASFAGRLLHAVPSAMFVVCFETVVASARHRVLGTDVPRPDPRFRAAHWALAPIATWSTWRTHVLTDPGTNRLDPTGSDHDALKPAITPVAPREAPAATAQPITAGVAPQPSPVRPARPRTPDGPRVSASATSRSVLAAELLRQEPDMTASALAEHLTRHGHVVSARTANRIRESARRQLTEPAPPAAPAHDLDDTTGGLQ